jgi:hypothetical protein
MTALLDYAWQKPTPAAIVAGGYAGVLRYLSTDGSKNLTPGERDGLLAAGLSIGLVWETTATRASQGYAAGQHDAQMAEAQADALGYPAGCPIFYAVDYDAAPAAVVPYFQGVQGLARRPVGVYGSANVIEAVPAAWKWQTVAWSRGRVSPQAHLYQTLQASLPGCDLNQVRSPVPLWSHASGSSGGIVAGAVNIPNAPNFPTSTTTPAPAPQEDDDMKAFIKVKGNDAVYVTDGLQAWHVADPGALADLVTLTKEGLYNIKQADPNSSGAVEISLPDTTTAWVREVGRVELLGQIVPAPSASVSVTVDDAAIAKIAQATRAAIVKEN